MGNELSLLTYPQCGHIVALLEILVPHSGQSIKLIFLLTFLQIIYYNEQTNDGGRVASDFSVNDNLEATGLAVFKEIFKEKSTESVLSDYCDFQEGYVNPPQEFPEYFDGKVKWLRGVDFSSPIIINTDEGFNSAGKSALLFEPNTIVITKSGTIGKLGIIADYMCGNRATINIKPKSKELLPFVYFFLKSIQPKFYDMAVGSAQVNLYVSVLQQIACPKYDDSFEKFSSQAAILLGKLLENSKEIIHLSELQEILLGELSR